MLLNLTSGSHDSLETQISAQIANIPVAHLKLFSICRSFVLSLFRYVALSKLIRCNHVISAMISIMLHIMIDSFG